MLAKISRNQMMVWRWDLLHTLVFTIAPGWQV